MFVPDRVKIFLVSDFTGETAEYVTKAAASQFGKGCADFVRYRYVNNKRKAKEVLEEALRQKAIVVYTIVIEDVRRYMQSQSQKMGVKAVDILGPLLVTIQKILGRPPIGEPGLHRKMDERYFKRVKAIEFAIKCDDGKNPHLLKEAELVIIGVSRASKTPLSMYLAHKGLMVANIPLVPEVEPPSELFEVPRERVVGLVISADKLVKIRTERLKVLGLDATTSSYASWERVKEELDYARKIMRRVGCKVVDVTDRAIEETAQEIIEYLTSIGLVKGL